MNLRNVKSLMFLVILLFSLGLNAQEKGGDIPTDTSITNPTLVATYHTPDQALGVYVNGNYAYVADGISGLQIIRIFSPSSPSLSGTYNTPGSANEVYVNGNYAYVADGNSGLQIINISTPSNPTLTGTYNTSDYAYGVYVSGNYAYVADGNSGLQIINISTPSNPTLTGTYNTSGHAYGVYVSGNYAYVADGDSGLQIINISTPSSPTLTGAYNTPGFANGIYVSENYAYIADDFSSLQIINVSTPSSPTLTGTYNVSGYANGVYVSGNYAYVASGMSGLKVINISTPSNPTLIGTCDDPGSAHGVYVSGNYAYVADDHSGLKIIDVEISPPTLVTNAVSDIGFTTATCGGNVIENGDGIGVIARGVCWNTSANPTTANSKTSNGTGTGSFLSYLTGLNPGTTYFVRAYATNIFGTAYGDNETFTTISLSAPIATTKAPSGVNTEGAVLNGTVNANNQTTTVTFQYGTTTSYGTTVNATPSTVSGTVNTSVNASLSSLLPDTTYHFRVVATNSSGTSYGSDLTFSTGGTAPAVITNTPTAVSTTGATLNGIVNANNQTTTVIFQYGETTSYGSTVSATPGTVTGTADISVNTTLTGLLPNTTYHYRVEGQNTTGTTYGANMIFTTGGGGPTVITNTPSGVYASGATLNGTVNANSLETTVTFQYGLTTSYGTTHTASQSPVTGSTDTAVSYEVSGLTTNTTYHYRVIGQNALGTTYGSDMMFNTGGTAPAVTTNQATVVTINSATLNGTVNANNQSTTVTFEYGTDTSYGTVINANPSTISGLLNTTVTRIITGLSNNTTYHYRAVATNASGTSYGSDMTFNTNLETFVIESDSTGNGTINPEGTTSVNYGQNLTYTITPDEGYHADKVIIDGVDIGSVATYIFSEVTANHTIYVEFKKSQNPIITSFTTDEIAGVLNFETTFHVSAYDPDGGEVVSYKLDVKQDGTYDETSSNANFNYIFRNSGAYQVTVTVFDDEGAMDISNPITITVTKTAPISLPIPSTSQLKRQNQLGFIFNTWIVNPFYEDTTLSVKAYNEAGELVKEEECFIYANGKKQVSLDHFSEVDYTDITAELDQYAIIYTEIENANGKMLSYLSTPLCSELLIPHIAEEVDYWDSYAYISNPAKANVNLEIAGTEYLIGTNSSILTSLDSYLNDTTSETNWGTLSLSYSHPFGSTGKMTGFEMFVKTGSDGAATELVAKGSTTLYIPHIPTETDIFWTGLVFVNNSDDIISSEISFYNSTGTLVGTEFFEVQPNSKLKGLITELFPTITEDTCWAEVNSSGDLSAIEIYGTKTAGICGVSLSGKTFTNGILPVVEKSETTWTGVAFTNPQAESVKLTIQLKSNSGEIKMYKNITIEAKNRFTITLTSLFGDFEIENTDYFYFECSLPIIAMEVVGDNDRTYMKAISAK